MDALQSFVFLTDNLPIWISKLHELSRQVSERYTEFTKLSQTSSLNCFRRKKTGSTESLRPNDGVETEKPYVSMQGVPTSTMQIDINPSSKHLFQEYRQEKLRRKRKSASISSAASGPQKIRSRMSLIVYYDSAIQEGFEMLVRQISSARNNLRKGRTAASFKARMSSLQMEESPFGSGGTIELHNPNIPRLPRNRNGPFMTDEHSNEVFDQADKFLEAAQSLCEVGAHQFLRDGNCAEEIVTTKEKFEYCLRIAEEQVSKLRMEAEKAKVEEEWREQLEARTIQADAPVEVDSTGADATRSNGSPNGAMGLDTIEVDDKSDTSSLHIDLTAFRSTRRCH